MLLQSPARIALLAAALAVPVAVQQPPPPTFRTGIHLIELDVRVFDAQGRFVADLTRDDFELLEEGLPRTVAEMLLVGDEAAPSGPLPGSALGPEAASRPAPLPGAQQTWIFMFDLNHLSPGSGFERARDAVRSFLQERFREGDLGGIAAGDRMINNRISSVREELVAAVGQLKVTGEQQSRRLTLIRELPRLRDEEEALLIARDDREALERALRRYCNDEAGGCGELARQEIMEKARRMRTEIQRATTQTLTAINALASGLARIPGPKTIVFISEGFVVQELESTVGSVVGQVARAGARVYTIDVRGLNRGTGASMIDEPYAGDTSGTARMDAYADGPSSLAVDTGGMLIRNENNFRRALDTIARDANRYYVLAFEPASTTWDGAFRRVEVRVKRPGLKVRARRGYLALEPARLTPPKPLTTQAPRAPGTSESVPALAPTAASAVESLPPMPPVLPLARTRGETPAAVRLRPDREATIRELSAGDLSSGSIASKAWEAYQKGDIESAAPLFEQAITDPDARPWVFYAHGLTQVGLGRPAEAIAAWERLRRDLPEFEPVYMDLAATHVHMGDLSAALAVLRDAQARWPKNTDIHNAFGVIHVRRSALDEAIKAFTRAVETAPDEPLGYFNLGRAHEMRFERSRRYVRQQNRWVASEADRKKAIAYYETHVRLGGTHAPLAAEAIQRLEWNKDPI